MNGPAAKFGDSKFVFFYRREPPETAPWEKILQSFLKLTIGASHRPAGKAIPRLIKAPIGQGIQWLIKQKAWLIPSTHCGLH